MAGKNPQKFFITSEVRCAMFPVNPLLAEPMYLNGTIERVGTGTRDIVKLCKKSGLKELEYIQEEMFRTILWRKELKKNNENGPENYTEIPKPKYICHGIWKWTNTPV